MTRVPRLQERTPADTVTDRLPAHWHPVVRRVLLNRGIGEREALDASLKRLAPASRMGGLDAAAALVADCVQQGAAICIVGDYDADGATATSLLLRGLHACGHQAVQFVVPDRFALGYGLSPELVGCLPEPLPQLLITVDNGISSLAGVQRAQERGMRVIVTDHHLPGERLPTADAIVNPNLPGEDFPSRALAGVGVAFYLMTAIRRQLQQRGWFEARGMPEPDLRPLLDLVALGTVADVVPLDANNRILVTQGLRRIRSGEGNAGIRALLEVAGRDVRHCSTADLGFAVGPRLNAAGRLEDMEQGIHCLTTDDEELARRLAEGLDSINRERREIQGEMQQQAEAIVQALLQKLQQPPPVVMLAHESWHAGVVGLVASRIKERLYRPVLALAPAAPGSTEWKGSGRSIAGFHLRDFLAELDSRNPGLLNKFGGHAMAAGFSIDQQRIPALEQAVAELAHLRMDPACLQRQWLYDGSLKAGDFTLELARQLADLLPWGQHCPAPRFVGSFLLEDYRLMAGRHLRLQLRVAGGPRLEAVAFNTPAERVEGRRELELLYRLEVNRYRGRESLQLMVEELW